ncbi:hypothetical protein ANCCAN_06108 [Ancylostoma caninum]|uniref:Deltamethrin resistance protein prag01 domain-containing protein n=1 Tax=Ancylostoma caninum TaxID=29170 RepID=A0A368GTR7_ANCCA|nr:hypothetical protein ANCCAN_06108 [Ancylostoma caninum]
MNRALFSRFMALRRAASMQPKRFGSGGHHEVLNPGPPVTLDYMAVPFQPYAKVHAELQAKFNRYLFISATMFIVSFGLVSKHSFFLSIISEAFCTFPYETFITDF